MTTFYPRRQVYVKLHNHVLQGREMPMHIQVAYGRHIFRLAHGGRNCGLWLRDLPLNMHDLAHEYQFYGAYNAYLDECKRTGEAAQF